MQLRPLFLFSLIIAAAFSGYGQGSAIKLWETSAPNAVGNTPLDIPTITPFPAPKTWLQGRRSLFVLGAVIRTFPMLRKAAMLHAG
jgi:hypothetical protein